MDTISLESTIQTLTNNFKADDATDYSLVTYFSDSQSVLKLQGPSATIYNNTNFASPDFNYPGTLTKDITIPLVSGAIPQGTYILTATTRVYKTAVPISSVTLGTNTILVSIILDGNFIPSQSVTWTGGANAGTYTVSSAVTTAFGVEVTFVESLVSSSTTGSLSFFELVTTVETYTYCYTAPSTVLTLAADCPTATLGVTNSTNYAISCEGQTIQPDSVTATLTLNAPLNSGGSPVYPQTVTSLPTGTTYDTTELWTQTWTGTLVSVLTYTLPSGLQIETTITGTTSLNVVCDDSLCCMSSCLQAATNALTLAIATGNLNTILAAVAKYTQILGAFMMYSVGVRCGDTTVIDTAVASMKALLADQNCCNDCGDTGESVQIVAIYNVNVSGNTVTVQSGDVYIDVSASVIGSNTDYTLTLDTTQLGNFINSYLVANPTIITNIVAGMGLYGGVVGTTTGFDTYIEFDGDITTGSPIVTNLSFASGIVFSDVEVGDIITTNNNFPVGTYVLSKGASTITMSDNALSTTTDTFTIGATINGILIQKMKTVISGITTYKDRVNLFPQMSLGIGYGTDVNAVTLINDEAAPGNIKNFGTNHAGVKGWYSIASELVQPIATICGAGVNTDIAVKTVTASTAGTYLINVSGQFSTSSPAPTTVNVSVLKNGTIINTNCGIGYTDLLTSSEYVFPMTTIEALVDTDVIVLRVTPVGQGVVAAGMSVTLVRI